MLVHGYTHTKISKHFWIINKALGIVLPKDPLILSLVKIFLENFIFVKEISQIFAKWPSKDYFLYRNLICQGKILPKLKSGCVSETP